MTVATLKNDVASLKTDLASLKTDLRLLKWMTGFVLAFQIATLAKLFIH